MNLDLWLECEHLRTEEINLGSDHGHIYDCDLKQDCPYPLYFCLLIAENWIIP